MVKFHLILVCYHRRPAQMIFIKSYNIGFFIIWQFWIDLSARRRPISIFHFLNLVVIESAKQAGDLLILTILGVSMVSLFPPFVSSPLDCGEIFDYFLMVDLRQFDIRKVDLRVSCIFYTYRLWAPRAIFQRRIIKELLGLGQRIIDLSIQRGKLVWPRQVVYVIVVQNIVILHWFAFLRHRNDHISIIIINYN